MDKINPEYNIAKRAGSLLGFRHTEETKIKCGIASKLSRGFSGKHREKSQEEKTKISLAHKGRVFTKEHREKISVSKKTPEMIEKLVQRNRDRAANLTTEDRARLSQIQKSLQFLA